jgi:biopolymer transport protein ExbD
MRVALRLCVALAIILPLLFWLGGGWLTTFAIALVGFGTGRLVEHLLMGSGPHGPQAGLLVLFPLLGLLMLAGVKLVEYRLEQRSEEMRTEMLQAHVPVQQAHTWRVQILPDGSVMSDGQPAAPGALQAPEHTDRAEVSAQGDVPYDRVIAVMDQIRAACVEDILLTSP